MHNRSGFTLIHLVLGLAVVAIVATAVVYTADRLGSNPTANTNGAVFCTADAKLCPDGVTYVGRQAPNCEFAACPETNKNNATNVNAVTNTNTAAVPADWKTYTNTTYGYSVKYPNTWPLNDSKKDGVTIGTVNPEPSSGSVAIVVLPNKDLSYIETYKANYPDGCQADQSAQLGGVDGKSVTCKEAFAGGTKIVVFAVHDSKLYQFSYIEGSSEFNGTVAMMLSTFQFTDQTAATKDWKAYTNTAYGFSIQYPKDWDASALDSNCPPQTKPKLAEHNVIGFVKGKESRDCLGPSSAGTFVINTASVDPGNGVRGTIVTSERSSITIGGVAATKVAGVYAPSEDPSGRLHFAAVTFSRGGRYFLVNYHGDEAGTESATFDTYLSTFTFTN